MQTFNEFGLDDNILMAIKEMGFETPSEIQTKAVPLLCNDKTDFIGLAQTGTGKTAAFGLPLIHHVDPFNNDVQALILSPTRELCQQIAVQLEQFAKYSEGLKMVTVYGGANISEQIRTIRKGVQIVIATPGRLLDLMKRKAIRLQDINTLVLDEADEMLNMGFKEDLDAILSGTSEHKNTWLFSATMPKEIRRIIKQYMSEDAVEISVNQGNQSNKNIDHQYIPVKSREKNEALKRYLDAFPEMRGIIFCRTKAGTQTLADGLAREGYKAEAIHGDLSQNQRDRVMGKFKAHQLQVLVATDVAARGIDVNGLTHVIHHALPDDAAYYTHRSGRTARAGKKGISIAFVSGNDQRKLKDLQRKFDQEFTKVEVPGLEDVMKMRSLNWAESVNAIEVSEKLTPEVLNLVAEQFIGLSKEDLIAKLLHKQLGSILEESDKSFMHSHEEERSSRRDRDRGRDRDRREDRKREPRKVETPKGYHRYFINVGKADDLDSRTLTEFISDQSGMPKSAVGDVRVLRTNSFFEIQEKYSTGFSQHFQEMFVGDRELRVNRDDDGSNKKPARRSYNGDKPKFDNRRNGGGSRNDSRGGSRRSSDGRRSEGGNSRPRRSTSASSGGSRRY